MELWIILTLGAAAAQTVRFMLQKQLKTSGLSNGGATLARFLYSAPIVAVGIALYALARELTLPELSLRFWLFALSGGLAQILATICVVALFSFRNFAVGITFKKSEVVITAVAGFLVLGEVISWIGGLAIGIGLIGVLILSDPPGGEGRFLRRVLNPAAGLGILSGVFFAISAVGYGGATRSLETGDLFLRAGYTLALVTACQTLALGLWLRIREPGQISAVLNGWRTAGVVGIASMIGSFCWFSAFAIQNVTYVYAVGQIELIFSIMASALFFKEKITKRELLGIAILGFGIILLVLFR